MNTLTNEQLTTISIFKIIDENGIETFNYNLFNKTFNINVSILDAITQIENEKNWLQGDGLIIFEKKAKKIFEENWKDKILKDQNISKEEVSQEDMQILDYCDGKENCSCEYTWMPLINEKINKEEENKKEEEENKEEEEEEEENKIKTQLKINKNTETKNITIYDRLINTACLCGNN
jgi:hypothetical protein